MADRPRSRSIFLLDRGETLRELREAPYDSEALLQRLVADHPRLLAGDQVDRASPRRWLLVSREVGIPGEAEGANRWSLDHLFLDQDAIPTLVEVKRASDGRIRREVVGQLLDYAANAVAYWPIEHLRARFETLCALRGRSAEDELAEFLGADDEPLPFWQRAKTNLQAGRIRMLFVADEIPTELRRVVEFLNGQMDPAEVLAIEVKQFVDGELRTMVPTVVGQTAEAVQRKGTGVEPTKHWDEASFVEDLAVHGQQDDERVVRRILEWARSEGLRIWWGAGKTYASFVPIFDADEGKHQLFNVWASGRLEFYFYWYASKPPFSDDEKRETLRRRLNEIPGVSIPETANRSRPSMPLSSFRDDAVLDQLLAAYRWFLDVVREAAMARKQS